MRMGLREASQHFSKAIKAVRSGKQVILTDRGKPFAIIQPLVAKDESPAGIPNLTAEGLLLPGALFGQAPRRRWEPVQIKGVSLSESLRDDRDAR